MTLDRFEADAEFENTIGLEKFVNKCIRLLIRGLLQAVAMTICGVLVAASDDVEEVPVADVIQQNQAFPEENFDQMLFQGYGNASAARDRIKGRMKMMLDELDRNCSLSADQKKRLTLSAQGDMKRFFDEVEQLKVKFRGMRQNRDAVNDLFGEMQPIQTKMTVGLFGEKSLFQKTVRTTLTEDQIAKYQAIEDDRRRFRYRATIGVTLSNMGKSVRLRPSQCKALTELLVLETQPPASFGDFDYQYVMYQFSHLPEDNVKPLLDVEQWKLFAKMFEEFGELEQVLRQQGLLPKEDAKKVRNPRLVEQTEADNLPVDATRPSNQQE